MGLPLYLAMTAPELFATNPLPEKLAYMACCFSPYNSGLSNIPPSLPPASMLILNDSTPAGEHDPVLIGRQLCQLIDALQCSCVLLDFQRPANEQTYKIAQEVLSCLSCPVAVSEEYAENLNCAVFLSSLPLGKSLETYLSKWKNREVWLEIAPDSVVTTVDSSGSSTVRCIPYDPALLPHYCDALHCHYKIEPAVNAVYFTLQRLNQDLAALLQEAENLGVTKAVGLYQELGFSSEFHCF